MCSSRDEPAASLQWSKAKSRDLSAPCIWSAQRCWGVCCVNRERDNDACERAEPAVSPQDKPINWQLGRPRGQLSSGLPTSHKSNDPMSSRNQTRGGEENHRARLAGDPACGPEVSSSRVRWQAQLTHQSGSYQVALFCT